MAKDLVVAQFHEYGAAHRALCELIQAGILANRVSIIAGDRSNAQGANRDFGILENETESYIAAVRRGTTLLAVATEGAEEARVVALIERHAPFDLAELGDLAEPGPDRAADEWQDRLRRDIDP